MKYEMEDEEMKYYDYRNLSASSWSALNDLCQFDASFPDIDLRFMSEVEKESLISYMRSGHDGLSSETIAFYFGVAKELEALAEIELEGEA